MWEKGLVNYVPSLVKANSLELNLSPCRKLSSSLKKEMGQAKCLLTPGKVESPRNSEQFHLGHFVLKKGKVKVLARSSRLCYYSLHQYFFCMQSLQSLFLDLTL